MFKCFKMNTCKNYSSKCYECQSMADVYNHYPCYTDKVPDPKDMFELITRENLHELRSGEWIWDNKEIAREEHRLGLDRGNVIEPIGFRQIHILDIDWIAKTFMLSRFDNGRGGYVWEYFEENRFYRFKKER